MLSSSAFESIYEEFKNLVYNLSLSYVHNQEDAQDITQEVFVKIYQRYATYNPAASSLKTWVYQITINQSLDFIKSKKAKKRFGFITSLFHSETSEPIVDLGHWDHPGVLLEDKEELQNLFQIIDSLPDNQRTALILAKIEDRPQKEVAEIMNLSVKAVESLLHRAKQTISKNISWRILNQLSYNVSNETMMDTDKNLRKLEKIRKVEAPPFLFTRIRAQIDSFAEAPAPVQWSYSFAAIAVIVLALNLGVLLTKSSPSTDNGITAVVSAMQLSTSNDFYNE